MRSWTLCLLFPAFLAVHAQPIEPRDMERAADLRDRAARDSLAYDLVASLTTEVGPRPAGSDADARAVEWARRKFKALDFDRVSLEPVTFPTWHRGRETARVTGPFPQPLRITALGGSVATPEDGLRGPIAHFATLDDLEAAADGSLDGAVVFISNRMRRARDGSGYGEAVVARSRGASVAATKGASAILIRSIGTDDSRLPHTGLMRYAEGVERIPAAALSNPDADLLSDMLDRSDAVEVELEIEAHHGDEYTSYNVIGDILGSEHPDEYVILGCHLDSWDLGTGAVDDAAGCAITMAAAARIKAWVGAPRRTIRVILFANEEQGIWGGRAYQEAHADEMRRHLIGAESDFGAGRIYRFSTRIDPAAFGAADQISQVLAPLGVVRGDNNAGGGADLGPLRRAGMAVATLHQDGSDYFDYHHSANDTLDKIDPEALAQNVAAYIAFAYLSAQYAGDFGFALEAAVEQE